MTTPIQGDLPDWSRAAVDEAPQLIHKLDASVPAGDNIFNVSVPPNAVSITYVNAFTDATNIKAVGNNTGLVYIDQPIVASRAFGFATFTVFAVTDTVLTFTVTSSAATTAIAYIYAQTNGSPALVANSFASVAPASPTVSYGHVSLVGVSINPSTPLTFDASVPAPSAGETITILSVYLSIGSTASDGQASVIVAWQGGTGGTPSGYAAAAVSRVSSENVVSLAPNWVLSPSSSALVPGIYYVNGASSSVAVTAYIVYMTTTT